MTSAILLATSWTLLAWQARLLQNNSNNSKMMDEGSTALQQMMLHISRNLGMTFQQQQQHQMPQAYDDPSFWTNLTKVMINDAPKETVTTLTTTILPTNQRQHTHDLPWLVIFYHIYIPQTQEASSSTSSSLQDLRIILQDQMGQILQSSVVERDLGDNDRHGPVWLLYNTIGGGGGTDSNVTAVSFGTVVQHWIQSWCAPHAAQLHCRHVHHFDNENGRYYEDVTLELLFSFCRHNQNGDKSTKTVVYLHNKGSFHSRNGTNHAWRQSLTAAATSRSCLHGTSRSSSSCDLCGLLWQTVPGLHVPGNMWTSNCRYVRQLPSPSHFASTMHQHVHGTWNQLLKQGLLRRGIYPNTDEWTLGEGRYVWERWIGSHPNIQPCDVSTTNDLSVWKKTPILNASLSVFVWEDMFEFSAAPRLESLLQQHWKLKPRPNKEALVQKQHHMHRRLDVNLLPGLLLQYAAVYGQWPRPSSWIWRHFPDADTWYERQVQLLAQNQTPTVQHVVEQLTPWRTVAGTQQQVDVEKE